MTDKPTGPNFDEQGYHLKYAVKRLDGRDMPGHPHSSCEYFVLDLTHDPHARKAIVSYMESCYEARPKLWRDLYTIIHNLGPIEL